MGVYEYKGINKQGQSARGSIDAENTRAAHAKLKKQGIYVSSLKDKTKKKGRGWGGGGRLHSPRVGVKELANTTRQLSTLIKANVPLVESLSAVADQTEDAEFSSVLSDIKNRVNEGSSLHKALEKYPKIFNKIYISMCEAGETSGTLDIILLRLAEFTESQTALNSKVRSALLYPAVMCVFTFLILIVLFVYVIPKMIAVFEASPDLILPWYTEVIIGVSDLLINYWLVLIIAGALFVLMFRLWKNTPHGQVSWDRIKLRLPILGKLTRVIAVSRFTRTLSTLLAGGVPMLSAMGIVRNVVNNEVLASAIDNARDNISEGESIAGPLKKSGEFPPIVIHMVNIGEKTGELENMLTQVSNSYDHNVKVQVDGLTSLMEPLMIIVMGGVIGIIVFAIMIPMFDMSSLGG